MINIYCFISPTKINDLNIKYSSQQPNWLIHNTFKLSYKAKGRL